MTETSFQLNSLVEELDGQELPCFMSLPTVNPRPSREAVFGIAQELRSILFPGYFSEERVSSTGYRYALGHTLEKVYHALVDQIMRGLCFRCDEPGKLATCRAEAEAKATEFMNRLPEVRQALSLDAEAAHRGDPAATSVAEAIFCYPGMTAMVYHRLAHELYLLEVPLIARMLAERSHSLTGIDIHPGATIGEGLFIDHGTGVVIGETSVIGKNVRIYQGVTLGARSFPLDENGDPIKGIPRHPILEDDVTIYSGATILGRITVGKGTSVGGNVWLTESVPPGSRVSQRKPRQEGFESGGGI